MLIEVLKSKIHNATVVETFLDYEGSIGIDEEIMEKSNLVEFEKVQVWNINNGERFETYVIKEPRGSRRITINGASARLVHKGDKVIIASFCLIEKGENFTPTILILDEKNNPKVK
ncbi:MAG: aspartate 1-decarboxylase [Spirochaetia bacterium]|nr:aspartate 1-decarboxylase [Spirochaetota bacterium]MCX8095957.1 aspartate 1-decarboxylase [Spirochaetota bacterium]MDW8112207.1 aspartate 1-decarboxylase [Spirochaetia bacterium]